MMRKAAVLLLFAAGCAETAAERAEHDMEQSRRAFDDCLAAYMAENAAMCDGLRLTYETDRRAYLELTRPPPQEPPL
jgi:hypothetical protein